MSQERLLPHYCRLLLAASALYALPAAGCATTPGAAPRPFPMPGAPPSVGPDASPPASLPGRIPGSGRTSLPSGLIDTALGLQGVQYRWGGSDPNGFDCSGFTQYVFGSHGVALPREVSDQYRYGRAVRLRELQPGDLIFFKTTAPGPSHVAISLGGDEFVHAPSSTGVVRVERLSSRYWSRRLVGVRRIG